MRRVGISLIAALAVSTIIILVLLTLGITAVTVPNAFFLLGALTVFASAVLSSAFASQEEDEEYDSRPHRRSSAAAFPSEMASRLRSLWDRNRALILLAFLLLVLLIVFSLFVSGGTLILTLLPLWVLIFLVFSILFLLLLRRFYI